MNGDEWRRPQSEQHKQNKWNHSGCQWKYEWKSEKTQVEMETVMEIEMGTLQQNVHICAEDQHKDQDKHKYKEGSG